MLDILALHVNILDLTSYAHTQFSMRIIPAVHTGILAAAHTAAAFCFNASASGCFPVYTPSTVFPVTPRFSPAWLNSAVQSLAAAGVSGAQVWLKGTVDLISKVVPVAPGCCSRETHRSATSSRLILPCGLVNSRIGRSSR
jgi:hypothetical protein